MRAFLIAVCAALAPACSCTHIDAGHVGVLVEQCSGGGVQQQPVGVGYHWTGACSDIVEFPTYQQTAAFKDDAALSVNDAMGLPIRIDAVLNFTIDEAKVPAIYQKFRKDLDNIESTYLRQVVYECTKEVFSGFTAQQLYSDKQEPARASIQKLLADKIKADGFVVTQFTINKTVVPDNVTKAIQGKVAAIEEAQRVEQRRPGGAATPPLPPPRRPSSWPRPRPCGVPPAEKSSLVVWTRSATPR